MANEQALAERAVLGRDKSKARDIEGLRQITPNPHPEPSANASPDLPRTIF